MSSYYIHVTRTVKIRNPADESTELEEAVVYEGGIEKYIFNTVQENNLKKIQEIICGFFPKLTTISAVSFNGYRHYLRVETDKPIRLTKFVAWNEDKSVVWYKYEGTTAGGGQNYIYLAGKKMKLTNFLKMKIVSSNTVEV